MSVCTAIALLLHCYCGMLIVNREGIREFALGLLKVVGIEACDHDGSLSGDSHVVFDHEVHQTESIDEDDFLGDGFSKFYGVGVVASGGDEDTFVGLFAS